MKKIVVLMTAVLTGVLLVSTSATAVDSAKPRSLRIRVFDTRNDRLKANVNVPMSLVRVGLRLGARFAPELEGLDVAEIMEAINQGGCDKIIDVIDEERGERVEIYAE